MGKLALLFVAAAVIGASAYMQGQQKTSLDTERRQSQYQQELLAERAAEAGLEMAVSQATRDFDAWRAGYDGVDFDGGGFDVVLQGSAAGPITVSAEGRYGDARHTVRTTVARLAPTPAALIVDADTAEVELYGSAFLISGQDTRPGSAVPTRREGNGRSDFAHSVWTHSGQVMQRFAGAADGVLAKRLRGATEQASIVREQPEALDTFPVKLSLLYAEALLQPDETFGDGAVLNNRTFGTPDDPQIVVVHGSATFSGSTEGYGLLIVRGSLVMQDDFQWEGLVLARTEDDEMDVVMADEATIYGALVARRGMHLGGAEDPPEEEPEEEPEPEEPPCECEDPPAGPPSKSHPDPKNNKKVLICHVPPGNPDNAHTISISKNAKSAHFSHHDDYDGPCRPACSCSAAEEEGSEVGIEEGGGDAEGASAGVLRYRMQGNAAIYYSTEAIGKLAARLDAVRDAARVVVFDQVGQRLDAPHDTKVDDDDDDDAGDDDDN